MAAPTRPSRSAVRAALLSARLYHDTLGDKSLLRYAGFGVLEPDRALEILARDAEQPDPYVPWPSRLRLGLAYRRLPRDQIDERANHIVALAWELLESGRSPDERVEMLRAAAEQGDYREPLTNARKWKTTITANVGRETVVIAEMEVRAPFHRVALMCDPRQWQNVSLFWYETKPVDGAPPGPLPSIDDPDARFQPWSGTLREKVAGMGVLTVFLGVDYKVYEDQGRCTVDYFFKRSPDSNLSLDDGTMTVERGEDGWLKTKVLKRIDFQNAPFGGPSSADLLAPSFIGTWMRVQQDFWAAKATEWQRADTRPYS